MVLRIFTIVATSGFLTALKCTKFHFRTGLRLGPHWGAYSAPPGPVAGLRGPTSKGQKEGSERASERKKEGMDRPPFANSWIRHYIELYKRRHMQ